MDFQADVATHLFEVKQAPLVDLCGGELLVLEGADSGARVTLGPLTLRVGTALGSQLRLSDPTVSRVHCQFSPRKGGFRLVDSGSTNGTFVDGVRVRDADLLGSATVRVGASVLRLELGNEPLRVPLSQNQHFGLILGGSIEMRRLYAILERVAPSDTTLLIQGETGTGKELVAREVHEHSGRKSGPFVAVDCGAIAPNVIESELFGHVRGAFSGAVGDRRGLVEEAHGGTLFLDEIGELPLNLQAKLLRVLESRAVRRVGANTERAVDVRVLAATNRALAQSVNDGEFREDLYYRLAVIEVVLPPLRARREDIGLIAGTFWQRFSNHGESLPPELLNTLVTRSWPGNVRELRNFIQRCVTLGVSAPQPAGKLDSFGPPALDSAGSVLPVNLNISLKGAREDALNRFERLYVETALRNASGNVTRAAEHSGVSRRFLQRLIARLGIRNVALDSGSDAELDSESDDEDE